MGGLLIRTYRRRFSSRKFEWTYRAGGIAEHLARFNLKQRQNVGLSSLSKPEMGGNGGKEQICFLILLWSAGRRAEGRLSLFLLLGS